MPGANYTSILGPDGNDKPIEVNGINNAGVIVGSYQVGSAVLGFIDNGGTYTILYGPDGQGVDTNVQAIGINGSGEVTGNYNNGVTVYSFIYNSGTYTVLSGPVAGDTNVLTVGISTGGEVAGIYDDSSANEHGFVYNSGTYTTLLGPDGNDIAVTPTGISASGLVVGDYETQSSQYGVFVYNNGSYSTLPTPTGAVGQITATGINNAGEVIGYFSNSDGVTVGFIYDSGTYTYLTGPDEDIEPTAINASGVVTGVFVSGGGNPRGFIYKNGSYTLLSGPGTGNTDVDPSAINDTGTVAGSYTNSSASTLGFTELCYLRGTRILTATGSVLVEDVKIGDRVVTRFGGVQRIKWIGRQSYNSRFLKENPEKLPVCIEPGALADDAPARKLFVSPGHSLLLGDTLVLASTLVNGLTVTQRYDDETPAMIDYFQIELESHDCIIAEGVWAETYADAPGLRAQFHNEAEYYALYPEEPPPEELILCAPRPERGAKLETALRPVAARAAAAVTPGRFEGWVETISDWRISGWAIDHAHPELPVLLEVMVGEAVIGSVLACELRPDLVAAGIGNGRHAFVFTPQARLRPADWPALSLRRASDGAWLHMAAACQEGINATSNSRFMLAAD